jgi:hypothetical protein
MNDVTLKDAYPIPRIDDTLDTLSGSCLFTTDSGPVEWVLASGGTSGRQGENSSLPVPRLI